MASKFPFFFCLALNMTSHVFMLCFVSKRGPDLYCSITQGHKAISLLTYQPPSLILSFPLLLMCDLSISSSQALLLAPHAAKPSQRTKWPQLRTLTPSGHLGQDLYTFNFCRLSEFFKHTIQPWTTFTFVLYL